MQVIKAMRLIQVPARETVIHQGALPQDSDCMYLLASGEVDIVIAGGGAQQTANEDRMVSSVFLIDHISSSRRLRSKLLSTPL